MDRYECRKAVLSDLEAEGRLVQIEDHEHNVGTCYRCGTTVEPMTSKQWFVKMAPLAKPAMEVVHDGRVKFVPDRFSKTYLRWMENVHDWCISRQLWWGHRIPAFYCEVRRHAHPAGRGRAGYLVLLRAVAVLHTGLAGKNQRAGIFLPHLGAGDRL